MFGSPDFVFHKHKLAVFVDGDFWHGYNWKKRKIIPKAGYWQEKILRNMKRDLKVNRTLRDAGWRVTRFWEHKVVKQPAKCAVKIREILNDSL